MVKTRNSFLRAAADSLPTIGNLINTYNMVKRQKRMYIHRKSFHKRQIDSRQTTAQQLHAGHQITKTNNFSKRKPQKKDFFNTYNLQSYIHQATVQTTTSPGRNLPVQHGLYGVYSQLVSEFALTTYPKARIYIHSVTVETMHTNQSNMQLIIDAYDVIATPHCEGGPVVTWQNGLSSSVVGGIGEATDTKNLIGLTPNDNPAFKNQWRLIKHHRVYLNPGEVWCHKQFRSINKIYKNTELILSANQYISGLSTATFMLIHGIPIHQTATATVSTSGGQIIDTVETFKWRYSHVEALTLDSVQQGAVLSTSIVPSTQVKMEEETDQAAFLENA